MLHFRSMVGALYLLSAVLIVLPGNTQDVYPPISTERPSVGTGADLVPGGSLQFENGAGLSLQRSHLIADLPETLMRFGLSSQAELRLLLHNEVYQRSPTPHVASFQTQDPSVGLKIGMGRANPVIPKAGILSLSLPMGGQSWTSGSYDPTITGIWIQTLGKRYSLNENAQATLTTLTGARRVCWAPSVSAGVNLSEALAAFGEYAPTVLPNGDTNYIVDGGFTLLRRKLTQLDMRAGYLKDSEGYHTLLSVGYSVRRDGIFPGFGHLARR